MKAKFVNMCPNCGGTISDERLELKLPCKQCLPEVPEKIVQMLKNEETFFAGVSEVRRLLKERDALKNYEEFYRLEKKLKMLTNFSTKLQETSCGALRKPGYEE